MHVTLTKEQIKQLQLELLDEFVSLCNSHKLQYYLAGGTLLGAVRHKGFIPWDDDIDLCMPRPDYEKFLSTFKSDKTNIQLINIILDGKLILPFSKIVNSDVFVDSKYTYLDKYLWIDIFPVDGLPSSLFKLKLHYFICNTLRRLFLFKIARENAGKTRFRRKLKTFLTPIKPLIPANFCCYLLNFVQRSYLYEECEYVGIVGWGLYGIKEAMKKSEFQKVSFISFEDRKVKRFSCWHSYLSSLYGSFYEFPPLDQRKGHEFTAFKLNK